jgi:hypothetical protein
MDAGTFVIALLTAAGAAAGPAALGTLPDATSPTASPVARCVAAPDERSRGTSDRQRTDTDVGSRQDTGASSSALAQELAQELADVVAESDDATSRRLAAALAAAGFEASAGQETAASRTEEPDRENLDDEQLQDDRIGGNDRADRLDDNRLDDNRLEDRTGRDQRDDELDDSRFEDSRLDDSRLEDDRLGGNEADERLGCDGRAADPDDASGGEATGRGDDARSERSSDLEDVLSSLGEERAARERDGGSAGRGGAGIADALERGDRAAG